MQTKMASTCLWFCVVCSVFAPSLSVLPPYLPVFQSNIDERNGLIEQYFNLGISYSEILVFLGLLHGMFLSIRQLKRILKARGLCRRTHRSDLHAVTQAIEEELCGSGSTVGYRQMTQRIVREYGLSVDKETVRQLLRILDPEGVNARLKHRLKRRKYSTKGPNCVWHIDGYDKLKPFGFAIHGGIDGYSRRIMWLEVAASNNDPSIIARYFVDCVREIGGTSRVIRADCGTENVYVCALQRFFRNEGDDDWPGDNSFIYGKSVSNQRIEAWWSILRRGCTDWWIRFFKDMRESGIYHDADVIHNECLKFCFMHIIRAELHRFATLWNLHIIRPSTNGESPSGRPDMLYFVPEVNATQDFRVPVDLDDIELAEERCCTIISENGCNDQFSELVSIIMQEKQLQMPTSVDDAVVLFSTLVEAIDDIR